MTFLIYEKDPVVCADICDALGAAYTPCTIIELDALTPWGEGDAPGEGPMVAILSVTTDAVADAVRPLLRQLRDALVVVIGDVPQTQAFAGAASYQPGAQRPVATGADGAADTGPNDASAEAEAKERAPLYLQRPFSSAQLLAVIRDGWSCLHGSR